MENSHNIFWGGKIDHYTPLAWNDQIIFNDFCFILSTIEL